MKKLMIVFLAIAAFACSKESIVDTHVNNDTLSTHLIQSDTPANADTYFSTGLTDITAKSPCHKQLVNMNEIIFDHSSVYANYSPLLREHLDCGIEPVAMCPISNGTVGETFTFNVSNYLSGQTFSIQQQLAFINDIMNTLYAHNPNCNNSINGELISVPQVTYLGGAQSGNAQYAVTAKYLCCGLATDF